MQNNEEKLSRSMKLYDVICCCTKKVLIKNLCWQEAQVYRYQCLRPTYIRVKDINI